LTVRVVAFEDDAIEAAVEDAMIARDNVVHTLVDMAGGWENSGYFCPRLVKP
jgi:hypothetical protein